MNDAYIARRADHKVIEAEWGQLTWYVSQEQGNSQSITVGECRIKPGCQNPRHHHPNCEEALVVLQGRICHTIGDDDVTLETGDAIVVPADIVHNARNIGEGEAVLSIAFTSADRQTVGE